MVLKMRIDTEIKESMNTLATRLKYLRGRKTMEEFGEPLGFNKAYIQKYETGAVKPTTDFYVALIKHLNIKGYLSDLRCAFNQACRWNYIIKNPLLNCQKIILPEPDILPFTKDEFRQFISVIDNEVMKDIAVFTLFTGLRIGDIVNIRLTDINLAGKYIKIVSSNERRPKNQKTNFVEIADELYPIIEKYLMRNREWLFETTRMKRKYAPNTISTKFKLYVHKAGINKKLNHKAIRKTFGCWLLNEDVDINVISKLLHHSSSRVTSKYYAKVLNFKTSGITNLIKI